MKDITEKRIEIVRQIGDLEEIVSNRTHEIIQTQSDISIVYRNVQDFNTGAIQVDKATQEITTLKKKISGLKSTITRSNNNIKDLRVRLNRIDKEIKQNEL